MSFCERALAFPCRGDWLYGVASVPPQPAGRGVLVVVGGPQYRAGSHRQFTLLARSLAASGIPTMRFDYRGMGDSQGAARSFEDIGDDLSAAIDHFVEAVPGVREVVVWGLCDAASAAMLYAARDPRVTGLVLLNPWGCTADDVARTTLKHYYRARLLEGSLWKKILTGRFDYAAAASSFAGLVRSALGAGRAREGDSPAPEALEAPDAPLPQRMLQGLSRFQGKVLLILSGADLTAKAFSDMANASGDWQRVLGAPRVTRRALAPADHTFSRRDWRDQVAGWTCEWVRSW
ncbi:hydrolase 1, exosortase A system-associated [Massilia horti]|uniref:Hydrolase 1, exosortase A system-associated n=1 Tax=Massilia horti TaxID=2562153 RepID=A0A4Y9T0Z2_9BURK|nr:hydrolase 1, exosortase A system-associated [Massilia horti]TFW30666.1 hydrolase 1, exosortase A system-associated [Massilia horti]